MSQELRFPAVLDQVHRPGAYRMHVDWHPVSHAAGQFICHHYQRSSRPLSRHRHPCMRILITCRCSLMDLLHDSYVMLYRVLGRQLTSSCSGHVLLLVIHDRYHTHGCDPGHLAIFCMRHPVVRRPFYLAPVHATPHQGGALLCRGGRHQAHVIPLPDAYL